VSVSTGGYWKGLSRWLNSMVWCPFGGSEKRGCLVYGSETRSYAGVDGAEPLLDLLLEQPSSVFAWIV
jgi:hypothetical protein